MKRFSAVAALCLPLFACAGAEPERTGFLHARASLEAPAGAAVEVVLDDIPPGYDVELVVLADPAPFRDHPERRRIEVTYLDIAGEHRSVVLPVQ